MDEANKTKILKLLKTVRGQLDGLIKMIDANRDCIEISNQLLASQSILKKINLEILKGHFTHCIADAIENDTREDIDEKMSEIVLILNKLLK